MIDLRSDTVTVPGSEMRAAIAAARVGDDFYGEDPTVAELETRAARLMAKEAALFVPSGTMGNLLAHLTHAPGGGEVVGPETAHSFRNEGGGPSRIAGQVIRGIAQAGGALDLDRYAALTGPGSLLTSATSLLWVEQPTRGFVVPIDDLRRLRDLADRRGVPIHVDGARIFNAAVALGVPVEAIARFADTVMFCLSKGLGAPVGSILAGPTAFIDIARRNRQMLGGGMRQAGVLAAAGLFALDHHVQRLAEDHANAQRLARGLAAVPGIRPDRETVETNMFYIDVTGTDRPAEDIADRLGAQGVLANAYPASGRMRFVTHLGIDEGDVDEAIEAMSRLVKEGPHA